jgi:hypothetical protein
MTRPFSSLGARAVSRTLVAALGVLCAAAGAGAAFPVVALAQAAGPIPCGDVAALKAAIASANSTPTTPATIVLAPGCRYRLTSADNGENGLPVVESPITVDGAGATIAGNGGFRIWDVGAQGSLTLHLVDVTGGRASHGGGILNQGTLRLDASRVYGNAVDIAGAADGGGLYNAGTAVLSAGRVDDNSVASSTDVAAGGGIENTGHLTVRSTRVDHNRAAGVEDAGIGGGVDNGFGGTLEVDGGQIADNVATSVTETASGGGVSNAGTAVLRASAVSGNTATSPQGNARGAGLANVNTLTLESATVSGNTATSAGVVGGGIYAGGGLTVIASHVEDNMVDNTGSADSAALGAGIFLAGGNDNVLTASSITRNRAVGSGAEGGGVFVLGSATVRAVATTVTANQPDNCSPPGSVAGCQG